MDTHVDHMRCLPGIPRPPNCARIVLCDLCEPEYASVKRIHLCLPALPPTTGWGLQIKQPQLPLLIL